MSETVQDRTNVTIND